MFPQFQPFTGPDGRIYTQDYFAYATPRGSIAAGQTINPSFTIMRDSAFEWQYSSVFGAKTGTPTPIPDNFQLPIEMQVTDAGSGRTLFNQNIIVSAIAGLGREPYPLPFTRIFNAFSQVNFAFVNVSADQIDNFQFVMHGRKIFDVTPDGSM